MRIFFLALLISNIPLPAQAREDLFKADSEEFEYSVSLPVNFELKRKYLLGICLHGLGGSGKSMIAPFSYYSRYMNMILACPEGNIADPSRNGKKWGYAESHAYVISFLEHLKKKYNIYPEVFLFGFS